MVKKIIIQSLEPIVKYKLKLEVSRRYGGDGLKVFILIDKMSNIELDELIKSSKISKEKVNEIVDYMENIGLVYTEGAIDKVESLEEKEEEQIETGNYSYNLVSSDSLLRFKHQKVIFKEFSSQGVKVYDIIRKGETNVHEIQKETKLSDSRVQEILAFMKNNGIIKEVESEESKKTKKDEIERKEKEKISAIENKIRKEEEDKISIERKKLEEERKKLEEKIKKEEEERKKLEEKLKKEEEEKEKLREKLEKEKKEAKKEVIEKEIEKKEVEIKKIQEKHAEHKEKEEEFIFKVDDIDEEEFNLFEKEMNEEPQKEKIVKEEQKKPEPEEEFEFKQEENEEEFNFGEEQEKDEEEFNFEEEKKPKQKKKVKVEEPPEEEEEEFNFEEESEPVEEEEDKEEIEEKKEEIKEKEIIEEDEEEFTLEEEEEEIEEKEIEEEQEQTEEEIPEYNEETHYKTTEMQLSEKYKKQKEIFDKFGPEGMKLYSMFTFETTIKNAVEMTKIDDEKAKKIIEYLIYEGLIETAGSGTKNKRIYPIQEEEEEEIEEKEIYEEEESEDENYNFTNIKIYDEEEEEVESEEEEKPVESKTQIYEQKLREEFGEKGVKIYRLIDGRKNAEQIMKDVGVDEDTIIKVFEFMEKEGMIKLEHPSSSTTKENEKENIVQSKKKMEPISDISTSATKRIIIDDRIPIDVPIVKKLSLPDRMTLEAKLLARFGGKALRVNTKINDETDVVSLAIELAISLDDLDEILYSISNAGGCTFATLSNEDIKRKYGEEAFELYELFGRDGIMLYELIGKMNIIDIIKFSSLDPRKAAKIIYKANLLLGIDDIDEETIYKSIKDVK